MASCHPNTRIHMRLRTKLVPDCPISISFPKGNNPKFAILKHCTPIGKPTIVRQKSKPTSYHDTHAQRPEHTNQIVFPIKRIDYSLISANSALTNSASS